VRVSGHGCLHPHTDYWLYRRPVLRRFQRNVHLLGKNVVSQSHALVGLPGEPRHLSSSGTSRGLEPKRTAYERPPFWSVPDQTDALAAVARGPEGDRPHQAACLGSLGLPGPAAHQGAWPTRTLAAPVRAVGAHHDTTAPAGGTAKGARGVARDAPSLSGATQDGPRGAAAQPCAAVPPGAEGEEGLNQLSNPASPLT
jgi:hypothetical protein